MAIKTFTTGEVLTAADTNAYLANSGLVYITQATLAGSFVDIAGCFSATYDSYLFQFSNTKCSGAMVNTWQLLNGTTPLTTGTYNVQRASLQGGAWVLGSFNGQASGYLITSGSDVAQGGTFTIYNPFLAVTTYSQSTSIYSGNINNDYLELMPSNQTGNTSFNGIRLLAPGGTWTTGKVIVYGFRQS